MSTPDALLVGALDLHAHGSPEISLSMPGRLTNVQWARHAADVGMRGFVVKNHIFPTTSTALLLGELFPELSVFASITLNPPAGGLSPLAVRLAIEAGARIVWLPTWSARSTSPHPSIFLERMRSLVGSVDPSYWQSNGLTVVDESGSLLPEVDEILQICAQRGVTVASGHLPIQDSLKVCRRARDLGANFILTHPLSSSVGASLEQQQMIAEMGGWIEHVFIGCMPMHQRMDPRRIVESINAVGADHCVLSTDAIESWNPPEPELLRMFIATLLGLGLDSGAVHLMTHENPAAAIGLDNEAGACRSNPRRPEETTGFSAYGGVVSHEPAAHVRER